VNVRRESLTNCSGGLKFCPKVVSSCFAEYLSLHGTAVLGRLTRKNLCQADWSSVFLLDKKDDESIRRPDALLLYP